MTERPAGSTHIQLSHRASFPVTPKRPPQGRLHLVKTVARTSVAETHKHVDKWAEVQATV